MDGEAELRVGLEERDNPWVRFTAAQSLCYLGKADEKVASILGEAVEKYPALRTHALVALASQDDAPCTNMLVELMNRSDASIRYGAFTALRAADENHEAVRGRRMGSSYWLHTLAADSESLVHLTTSRRNEIVLFGSVWPVQGEFAFPLGSDFTITHKEGDGFATITRVYMKDGEPTTHAVKYRSDLGVLLKGLSEMGGTYTEAVELVRRVQTSECLMCKLSIDSQPRGFTVQQLADYARRDPTCLEANVDIAKLTGMEALGEQNTLAQVGGYDLLNPAEALKQVTPLPVPTASNRNPGTLFTR